MSVCSLRWFAEDVLPAAKWVVRETADEVHSRFWKALERLDTRMQPSHVRRAWDGMLHEEAVGRVRAEAQGVTECVEAPDYRGDADRMRAAYVPGSVAASATDGPTGVEAPPPLPPPVGPPPMPPYREVFVTDEERKTTSQLLNTSADYIAAVFPVCDAEYVTRLVAALRNRADAFKAIESTP